MLAFNIVLSGNVVIITST